jgi:hypothetical protein
LRPLSELQFRCERAPLGIKITIKEKGLPCDPRQIPGYCPSEDIDKMSAFRMGGVFLMKQFMNKVYFRNLGMGDKETQMIKYLPILSGLWKYRGYTKLEIGCLCTFSN